MVPRWLAKTLFIPLLMAGPAPGAFAWEPTGVPVCGNACVASAQLIVPDGEGGAFIAWWDERNSQVTAYDAYVQRITANGQISAGWPTGGLAVCTLPKSQRIQSIALDGQGGLLVAWVDLRNGFPGTTSQDVYAQRILPNGTIAPGWPENGTPVSRGADYQDNPELIPDGKGGAYVAWMDWRDYATIRATNIYAQHLTAGGQVSPGWPADGAPVCLQPSVSPADLVLDDQGGVVVTWQDLRRGGYNGELYDLYAQRLTADGARYPGWGENGRMLLEDRASTQKRLVHPDRAGGFYVACGFVPPGYIGDSEYYVQRFTFDGQVVPGWPAGGLLVCAAAQDRFGLAAETDGFGGLLLSWYDYRDPRGGSDIYASRVLPSGSLAPGWPANGLLVSDPNQGLEYDADIAPDGAGGAYVAYRADTNSDLPSKLQHLDARGVVAPGWPAFGVRVSPSLGQLYPQLATDAAGGVIVAWDESGGGRVGIYAKRFAVDGPTATLLSIARADAAFDHVTLIWQGTDAASQGPTVERRTNEIPWVAVGTATVDAPDRLRFEDRSVVAGTRYAYRLLYRSAEGEQSTAETWVDVPALALSLTGFRPNPAVGRTTLVFSLPDDRPSRLEVLDVRGRVVHSSDVGGLGAGAHVLPLSGALPPGMYWIRLIHPERTLTRKGLVVR